MMSLVILQTFLLLQKALDTFTKELDKQVIAGVIKEFSNEFYSAQERIAEMQDALIEATLKKYQDIIDNLDRISTTLDNSLELKEARGDQSQKRIISVRLKLQMNRLIVIYKARETTESNKASMMLALLSMTIMPTKLQI